MLCRRVWIWMVFFAGVAFCYGPRLESSDVLPKVSFSQKCQSVSEKTTEKKPVLLRPICEIVIEREAYDLVYDGRYRQARIVHQYLTEEKLSGPFQDRGPGRFLPDPHIPEIISASSKDYLKSGFDQGHLCPAGDVTLGKKELAETFYLSNINPQDPGFNRGGWKRLEKHVRDLTKQHPGIHIFTGSLYLPHKEADGKKYVKYEVIGENNVSVPTHFFKVILDQSGEFLEAYILPNEKIAATTPLGHFKKSIENVERASGIVFPSLRSAR
jgi:endonuclease G, mitochondrial